MSTNPVMNRRKFLVDAAGVGIAGLAVGGVGGFALGRVTAPASEVSPAATEAPGTSGAPAPSAAAAEPFVIGSAYPLTGALASDGDQMKKGAALAIKEINAAGGIAGRPVQQVVIDADVLTPDGVSAACKKLVDQGVDAIAIGYFIAWEPSYDIIGAYGCPYLNATTFQQQLDLTAQNPDRYGNIFEVDPSEKWYGIGFPVFVENLIAAGRYTPSAKTVFILEAGFPYSQNISKAAQETFTQKGWQVVGVEKYVSPVTDWGSALAKIRNLKPGIIMGTGISPSDIALFQKQFITNPTDSLIYHQYGPSVPEFIQLAGPNGSNGVVWATVTGVYNDDIGKSFQQRYQQEYGQPAGYSNAGTCYDEVYMLAKAWAMVGDARNFKAVNEQLRTMIHRGVNGAYYMNNKEQSGLSYPNNTNDPGLGQAHLFFQIQNGQQVIIAPEPYTGGAYKPAGWQKG